MKTTIKKSILITFISLLCIFSLSPFLSPNLSNLVHVQANDLGQPNGPIADPTGPRVDPNQPFGPRLDSSADSYSKDGGASGGYDINIFNIPTSGTLTEALAPFFIRIISFLFALVGLLAILGIVYSSYILATSSGNEQSIQTGKKGITNAVIGLIVALSGYVIIYTIQSLLGI